MILQTIPHSKITKYQVYYNKNCAKTMEQIQQELGCQYMINTTLFNMDDKSLAGWLVIDGKVLCDKANPFGLSTNGKELALSYANVTGWPEFTGCYHDLIRNRDIVISQEDSNRYGKAYRSAIGLKNNGDVVFLCAQEKKSLMEIAMLLYNEGCVTALNYDGGGSSQCYCRGDKLTSSRKVVAYLCIWTDEPKDKADVWAEESWDKAKVKKGTDGKSILDGTRPKDNITRQEFATVLNRLGRLE